jgi:aryl-alcohol dehydrogenase-like predicted oxidoreductase
MAIHVLDGEAERVVGEAFNGCLPAGVHVSTKVCFVPRWESKYPYLAGADLTADRILPYIERSLSDSLERLRVPIIDLLFLHDLIIPDGSEAIYRGVPRRVYVEVIRPTFERLMHEGRIGAWAISAMAVAPALLESINEDPAPYAAQIPTNLLQTVGARGPHADVPAPPDLARVAHDRGVGVMGIQPTQAGALAADAFDRPIAEDSAAMAYFRQAAPFRALATEIGESPASLAHRYALGMPGVSTILLGVKNRTELRECVQAEAKGPLDSSLIARIDAAVAAP